MPGSRADLGGSARDDRPSPVLNRCCTHPAVMSCQASASARPGRERICLMPERLPAGRDVVRMRES